ncbi:arylsulfatase B-like [Babylonia areolata]|uniref:arylsulfatase B-like n=1 Tax=Babylonia areolata TaxID=304850 RepID=UPI003FD3D962
MTMLRALAACVPFFLLLNSFDIVWATKPNIVFILADDLGWADVGWRNRHIYSPTLDRMAREGMILNQSYVQSSCCPSRAALLSGRYPYHLGFQSESISAKVPLFLPDDQPILPQTLKSLGYATHMVGKWHLGFCNWRFTPTYRGFDSFYGFYNAMEDYYSHTVKGGYDFRNDKKVDRSVVGQYSTQLFSDRAVRIIQQHDPSQPLFLYLAFQAVHTPLQSLQRYVDEHCLHITDKDRRIKCGMIAAMDDAVNNVTQALKDRGLFDNTFIIFSSDNGGPVHSSSTNWPLRGSKITLWEGGTRAASFVYGPAFLQQTNKSYEELVHIVDWYPTLVEAAGGGSSVPHIDGISQWKNLKTGGRGPRTEFLYNMDDVKNRSALRQGPVQAGARVRREPQRVVRHTRAERGDGGDPWWRAQKSSFPALQPARGPGGEARHPGQPPRRVPPDEGSPGPVPEEYGAHQSSAQES